MTAGLSGILDHCPHDAEIIKACLSCGAGVQPGVVRRDAIARRSREGRIELIRFPLAIPVDRIAYAISTGIKGWLTRTCR
jgi:hypothetical protein